MGAGEVARMKPDPMQGLASEPKAMIAPLTGEPRSTRMHGAYLARIDGYYHLFVAERRLSHEDLGRTGLPGGTDDTFVAVSSHPDRDYGKNRYLAFPYAGQTTLFRDAKNALWATYSCTDTRGVFRLRPGAFRVEQVPAYAADVGHRFLVSRISTRRSATSRRECCCGRTRRSSMKAASARCVRE